MTQSRLTTDSEVAAAIAATLPRKDVQLAIKRAMDVLGAAVLLVVLLPLLLAIIGAIRIDSSGAAIFAQVRLGKDTRRFVMYKFRSMYKDADDARHRDAIGKFVAGEPIAYINGKGAFKPATDPRETRVGRFLRMTGLDELPQLLNVLKGEMSLVGPRPVIPYELEHYKDWYYGRFAMRPGITGLWQVERHLTSNFEGVIEKDLAYINSFSIWTDVKIIFLTIPRIVFRGWAF